MKRTLFNSLLAAGTLLVLSGLPAFGMVTGEIKAKVPFDFRVGKTTLPAGEYVIVSAGADDPNLLEIRNENGAPAVLVMTEPVYPKNLSGAKPELVFEHIGNLHYLAQIWQSEDDAGNQITIPGVAPTSQTQSSSGSHAGHRHAIPANKG